jgi:uncharacterized protein YdcH (DUF465 family)
MRLFFAVVLGMMFFSGLGLAQEDDVMTAGSDWHRELSALQQSVIKLAVKNDQWAARDNAVKQQVLGLQAQLGRLEAQGDLLNKAAARLQDKNPRRAKQIARLEEENSDLDNRIQKAEGDIKLIQQSMASEAFLQKEKLKLMKMIYDCQQRQEALHEAILKLKKNTSHSRN